MTSTITIDGVPVPPDCVMVFDLITGVVRIERVTSWRW